MDRTRETHVLICLGCVRLYERRADSKRIIFQASLESNGRINEHQAYAMASTNLAKLLGVTAEMPDLVAYDGGSIFDLSSKVAAVISPEKGSVELF